MARLTLGALAIARGEYEEAGKDLGLVLGDPEVSPTERQLAERWLALVASNRAGNDTGFGFPFGLPSPHAFLRTPYGGRGAGGGCAP